MPHAPGGFTRVTSHLPAMGTPRHGREEWHSGCTREKLRNDVDLFVVHQGGRVPHPFELA